MEMAGSVVLLFVLAVGAYQDWREQQISLFLPILAAVVGILLWLSEPTCSVWELLGGMMIGMVLLAAAGLTGGQIGTGDGMMLLASGSYLGFQKNLGLFLTGLLLAGFAAFYLMVVQKRGRRTTMPFIPFLLAAYLLLLV